VESLNFIQLALQGKYDIQAIIGKGGMATVYKAIQTNLGRPVALKVIHQNLVHDDEFVNRFIREAQVCASLKHPNIVTIYDVGSIGTVHYMAMEYLEGDTLCNVIKSKKWLSVDDTIHTVATIAEVVNYIHKKGIIHRDVKSSNIFITNDGQPVLMDFGIVYSEGRESLSRDGAILGTPEYMSPEQVEGILKIDSRSDIYSLGVILYECLTGQLPFHSDNYMGTLHQVLHNPPPSLYKINSKVPDWLNQLVKACLEKDRDLRIQDGLSLEKALRERRMNVISTNKIQETRKIIKNEWALEGSPKEKLERPLHFSVQKSKAILTIFFTVLIILIISIAYLIIKPDSKEIVGIHKINQDELSLLNDSLKSMKKDKVKTRQKVENTQTIIKSQQLNLRIPNNTIIETSKVDNKNKKSIQTNDSENVKQAKIQKYIRQGEIYQSHYDFVNAVEAYEHALQLSPDDKSIADRINYIEYLKNSDYIENYKSISTNSDKDQKSTIVDTKTVVFVTPHVANKAALYRSNSPDGNQTNQNEHKVSTNQSKTNDFENLETYDNASNKELSRKGKADGTVNGQKTGMNNIDIETSFYLDRRSIVIMARPEVSIQKDGIVVVEITVDKTGKVIFAKPGFKGSTIVDNTLYAAAKKAALESKFNLDSNAADSQIGKIIYHFIYQ
jgi:serine/threonine protein kinase